MATYSSSSKEKLAQCDKKLQLVFNTVICTFDHTVFTGHRGEAEQNALFETKNTTKRWPDSKHNSEPSLAVDAVPYPIEWSNKERTILFAGFVLGTALQLGIRLRWGGDWNMNWRLKDENFMDLFHFELMD